MSVKMKENNSKISPKVSVIVPIYNVEKYIERCVDSLFSQTLDNVEFIFVDDSSPDRSIELLNSLIEKKQSVFEKQNWQVRIERMLTNRGLAEVRRRGLMLSKGNFIIHCDSDDWVHPEMLRLMYEKALEENSDVVVCDFNITNDKRVLTTIKGCIDTDRESFLEQMLLRHVPWSIWNKMFRRSTCYKVDLIHPKGNMGEDFVQTVQLVLNSSKVSYVPIPLYNYFSNAESITRMESEDKKMSNFIVNKENADIVYQILEYNNLSERYSDAIVSNKWYIKKLLWQTVFDNLKRKLWVDTYKEINKKILTNSNISLKDKVKYLLCYLHLFPYSVKNR